jgi:DNA-binding XRE family transcriptional regulator
MVLTENVRRDCINLLKHRRIPLAAEIRSTHMDKQLNEKIGTRIANFRKRHRMTQDDFAYDIGITRGFLSDIERGAKSISVETLARICSRTGIAANKLLGL